TDTRAFAGKDPQAAAVGGNVTIAAQGSVAIAANSKTADDAASGSLAVSFKDSGYGASVVVLVDLDDTLAFVGDGATVTALGNKAVNVRDGVHDDDGNQGTQSFNGFALEATSFEDHFLLAIGAAGTIEADKTGLGLSVTVDVNKDKTQATIGTGAKVNDDNTRANPANALPAHTAPTPHISSPP